MTSGSETLREEEVAPANVLSVATANAGLPTACARDAEDLPELVIEPRQGWHFINWRELWRYRELLLLLLWRDVKVRYKQTVLGAAWAILQPLTTMVVFTLFLGRVAAQGNSPVPYALFVLAGLLPWMFFSNAMAAAAQSVVGNQNLVTKVYFPRVIIPMAAAGAGLVDFLIGLVLFAVLLTGYLFYGQAPAPGWSIILMPAITLFLIIAALGVGALLSALTVAYRDFRHIVPFLVQIWMFATPAIYLQADLVIGARGHFWLPFNPAHGLIINFRLAMLGGSPDWYALAISGTVAVLMFLVGTLYFRRVEKSFADII